ncbi:MAG: AraC family transcriptional regulator [Verrucomicrobiae bacterium]|nr:AraC family transcriptional regulator [Verrucomicrobiae bacterium]NNJ85858.1 helix-turn-helix transcriptional regulator [Akkermansiaceae bacterium]
MNPSQPLQISYLYGGIVNYRPGESLGERSLTDYELVLLLQGSAVYTRNGASYDLNTGSILLARPGSREQYVWDTEQNTRHAYIHFNMENIPARWGPPDSWNIIKHQPDPVIPALFRHLIERIHDHPEWPSTTPDASTCCLIESLLSVFFETKRKRESESPSRSLTVSRALNHMRLTLDENPETPLTLGMLAEAVGVSEKHLCRLFAQSLGHSPLHTYQLLKLQLSISLLARSDLSIKEISQRCGYSDPLYFSRRFHSQFDCSPTQARRRMIAGESILQTSLPADVMPRLYW